MDYYIRIAAGKERAFLEIINALQALGVVEKVDPAPAGETRREEIPSSASAGDFARQYRDLVD